MELDQCNLFSFDLIRLSYASYKNDKSINYKFYIFTYIFLFEAAKIFKWNKFTEINIIIALIKWLEKIICKPNQDSTAESEIYVVLNLKSLKLN